VFSKPGESKNAPTSNTGNRTKVLLVVGVRLYREGLASELAHDARIDVVGQCGTAEDAIAITPIAAPDVVLVDIHTPHAFELLRALKAPPSVVRVVAFAVGEHERDIDRCAEAGVDGFVTEDVTVEEIANAVLAARCGELNCSPRSAAMLLRRLSVLASLTSATNAMSNVVAPLTSREQDILGLLVTGCSNKVIAGELHIQTTTVKNHVHRILEKLGVRTRIEAAARVRSMGQLPHHTRA